MKYAKALKIWPLALLGLVAMVAVACGGAADAPTVAAPILQATNTPPPVSTPTAAPTATPLPSGVTSARVARKNTPLRAQVQGPHRERSPSGPVGPVAVRAVRNSRSSKFGLLLPLFRAPISGDKARSPVRGRMRALILRFCSSRSNPGFDPRKDAGPSRFHEPRSCTLVTTTPGCVPPVSVIGPHYQCAPPTTATEHLATASGSRLAPWNHRAHREGPAIIQNSYSSSLGRVEAKEM